MASRAGGGGGSPEGTGNRAAWIVFGLVFAAAFAGVAFAIGGMLESPLLGWIGALFVFLPWASILLPRTGAAARERC